VAVLAARAIVVYLLRAAINRQPPVIPLRWAHVMFWGGMRGAVSIALVLSLPLAIQSRELMITLAFGYVIFSVFIQGLSIGPLLNLLGLTKPGEKQLEFESKVAEMAMAQSAVTAIDEMTDEHLLSIAAGERMKSKFGEWIERHQHDLRDLVREEPQLLETNTTMVQREIGFTQKQTLRRLLQRGVISEEIFTDYNNRIDERMRGELDGSDVPSAEVVSTLGNLQADQPVSEEE
jgi:CPA1 family monovalent cation:H+ antiporter